MIVFRSTIWRYARLPYGRFSFAGTQSPRELLELTRTVLANDDAVRTRAAALLHEPLDAMQRLTAARETSDNKRRLLYVSDVLVSLVCRHDIGAKGGVALLPFGSPDVTESIDAATPVRDDFANASLVRSDDPARWRSEWPRDLLEVCVDSSQPLRLRDGEITSATAALQHIVAVCQSHWPSFLRPGAVLVAVDAMRTNEGLEFFESHIPGRAFGVHLLPLAWMEPALSRQVTTAVRQFSKEIVSAVGPFSSSQGIRATNMFFQMDHAGIDWLVRAQPTAGAQPRISLFGEIPALSPPAAWPEELLDRMAMRRYGNETAHRTFVCVSRADVRALKDALAGLGPWVAIKRRRNLPWWETGRRRVTIGLSNDPRVQQRAAELLGVDDVLIEQVNVSSIDDYGRTGEFRWFACAIAT